MSEETKTATEEKTAGTTSGAASSDKKSTSGATVQNKKDQRVGRRNGRKNTRKAREPKEFEESILQIDRVTRVTKGGRQLRFRVSVVIGDQKGRVGFGIGKSSEVMMGVQKAIADAKRNLIRVPIFEDSIPHAIESKYKATRVLLFPAPEGKGVIAGGAVRKVLELAGVKNVLSKMHGSRNKINSSRATIKALVGLQNRAPHKKKVVAEAAESNTETVEATTAKKIGTKKTEVKAKVKEDKKA